jgi:hypothetical protein
MSQLRRQRETSTQPISCWAAEGWLCCCAAVTADAYLVHVEHLTALDEAGPGSFGLLQAHTSSRKQVSKQS